MARPKKLDQDTLDKINFHMRNRIRKDLWENQYNKFGSTNGVLNRTQFTAGTSAAYTTLEAQYRYDWISRKIINTIPDDATREGWNIETGDTEINLKFQSQHDILGITKKIKLSAIWGRLYGGGCILIGALDGRKPSEPLNINNITSITSLTVLDRWKLKVDQLYSDPFKPKYGEPEFYSIANSIDVKNWNTKIHESRIIRFDGAILSENDYKNNQYWHDSILTNIDTFLKSFGISLQTGAMLFQDFITKKLKIKGLKSMMAAGRTDAVDTRIQYAISNMMNNGIVLVDEDEEFDKVQTPIAGLPEMLNLFIELAAAASDIPRARLFGQSLGTLAGATETTRTYYDLVKAYQNNELKPQLEKLIKIIFLDKSGPTKGVEPENWKLTFNPLWQMTDAEIVDMRNKQSTTDKNYIESGVITPEEVTLSRFPENGYSLNTQINLEDRKEYTGKEKSGEENEPSESDL